MSEEFKLKPIHKEAIPNALAKAEQYRLLNEAGQAESICRDILRVDPAHQGALVTIVLALSDQFASGGQNAGVRTARKYAARLTDEHQRTYYSALVCERQARALLTRGMAGAFAYDGFREAMDLYQEAQRTSPPGTDDAILRWNSCVRTIRRANLRPRLEDDELPLE